MQSRGYGSQTGNSINNFHSVFNSSNDTGTPPLLDLSEFPSLTNARGGHNELTNALQPPGSKPYGKYLLPGNSTRTLNSKFLSQFFVVAVGMVKQPTSEQTEFQMSSEDFPALPGTDGGVVGVVGGNHVSAGGLNSVSSVISANNIVGQQMSMGQDGNSLSMMDQQQKNSLCMDMMQSMDTSSLTSANLGGGGVSDKAKRGVQTSPSGKWD